MFQLWNVCKYKKRGEEGPQKKLLITKVVKREAQVKPHTSREVNAK